MPTITLPSEVILDVLKFVPYETATKLVLTSKSLAKPLQVQLKEQRIAIISEIQHLKSSDLGEKQREIKSTWNGLVQNQKQLCADLNTNISDSNSILEQTTAILLFTQRLVTIQSNKDVAHYKYAEIERKRQPIIEKIESLESKLNQCLKSETVHIADWKRRQERNSIAVNVLRHFFFICIYSQFNCYWFYNPFGIND